MNERKEAWFKIIVLIISGVILYFLGIVALILAALNWLVAIFFGKRIQRLAEFCEYWNTESYKYCRYITSVNNVRPFPFSDMERMSKFKK